MSEIEIEKVTVRRGTDHITIRYVEEGQAKVLMVSAREVVRDWLAMEKLRALRPVTVEDIVLAWEQWKQKAEPLENVPFIESPVDVLPYVRKAMMPKVEWRDASGDGGGDVD